MRSVRKRKRRANEGIQAEYPFKILTSVGRNYTDKQKMVQFEKDGLTALFVKLVEADSSLLEDPYIKNGTSYRSKGMAGRDVC